MELWMLILISLVTLAAALKFFLFCPAYKKRLPPGPPTLPLLGSSIWLSRSLSDLEPVLRQLRHKYGPIVTLYIGTRPAVFITDRSLAHEALVTKSSLFSDRPPATVPGRIISANQHNISSAAYGPLWRLLRRNIMSEILHPSRVKSFAEGRKWVLQLLIERLRDHEKKGEPVRVAKSFQRAIFCLLLLMCFGQKLEESAVEEIERVQRQLLTSLVRFNIFAFLPRLGKLVFHRRWKWLLQTRAEQERVLTSLIRARRDREVGCQDEKTMKNSFEFSYVDSLLALELPEDGGRKLTETEMVSLCSEFLDGGTDTTTTSLQWILANLIRNQDKQEKLAEEIERVVGKEGDIREEDLEKMPYLKAVILEGLRRHPPGHFVLPHAVSEEVTLGGYVIPKNASINFMVAEIGMDKEVWEDPLEFRPERFLKEEGVGGVDITGSREIKMMPFGVGRRICPGLSLAMLHLEYFVANLVREFQWKPKKDGEIIDLAEKQEFTVVMRNPLEAKITSRRGEKLSNYAM